MRTTLKRGIGQSVDGNGDGAREFLPDSLSVIQRYRQPPKPPRTALGLVGRILFGFVAVVVMLGAALAGAAYLFVHQAVQAIQPHSRAVKASVRFLAAPAAHRPTTALIVGYDKRFKEFDPGRSDTLILVRADPVNHTISMLSFPRDLRVPIYCPGKSVWLDKINAAYANCNVKGSVATIHHLTGVPINYVITVNFRGFRQVVNRVGGVWIDVDHRYYNRNLHTYDTNYANINLLPGYQRLDGSQALSLVRFRHTDSDIYRNARQQAFVKALKEQLSTVSLFDLLPLVSAITHNVEVAKGGGGGPSASDIWSYARFAYGLPPGHFFQPRIQGLTGYSDLVAPPGAIESAVNDFEHPDVSSSQRAEESILGRKKKRRPSVKPSQVSVSVLNGNGVAGSAALARRELQGRGYHTVEPVNPLTANAPHQNYWHTVVYYDPDKKRGQAGAKRLADAFGNANVVKGIPRPLEHLAQNAMTVVVVGKTFHDLGPAPVQRIPKKRPPVVRRDPGATRGMLRKARRKVPFRLELPTIIERSSNPARTMPIRVYTMNKHKAVRLVFEQPNQLNYWGIEETDWNDAPILQKPNSTRFVKGRRYDLYFSGSHIHQIVLRENGATYWVENDLLNDLSNETMLAIAKGLRPMKPPK